MEFLTFYIGIVNIFLATVEYTYHWLGKNGWRKWYSWLWIILLFGTGIYNLFTGIGLIK